MNMAMPLTCERLGNDSHGEFLRGYVAPVARRRLGCSGQIRRVTSKMERPRHRSALCGTRTHCDDDSVLRRRLMRRSCVTMKRRLVGDHVDLAEQTLREILFLLCPGHRYWTATCCYLHTYMSFSISRGRPVPPQSVSARKRRFEKELFTVNQDKVSAPEPPFRTRL